MNREQVVRRIEEIGIVPVVRAPSGQLAVRAARALCAGGIGSIRRRDRAGDNDGKVKVACDVLLVAVEPLRAAEAPGIITKSTRSVL